MVIPRDNTFIWVTLVTKFLTGNGSCLWSAWYQANHQDYKRAPSNFDSVQWKVDHANLLDKIEPVYRQKYDIVQREWQNTFRFPGRSGAILTGTPDIVGISSSELVIGDAKTGKKKDEDWAQMLLYLHYFPLVFPDVCQGLKPRGEIIYADGTKQEVYKEEFNEGFKERVTKILQTMSSPTPPPRTPSSNECGYCKLAKEECPDRIDAILEGNPIETGDF
jgi:hypothetical protein